MGRSAALCFALLAALPAAAADPPWDLPEARADAQRVLEAALHVLRRSEQRDGRPAADALCDRSPYLRLLGVARLRVLGLSKEKLAAAAALAASADPPTDQAPAVAAAKDWVATLAPAPFPGQKLEAGDALRAVVAAALDRVEAGPEEGPRKRELLLGLLAFRAVVGPADRAWLAEGIAGLVEERPLLAELSAPDLATARGEDGAKLLKWLGENAPYLAWSRRAKRFVLDKEARGARLPTAEHRKGTRWPD